MNVSCPITLAVLLTILTASLSFAQEQPMKMPMPDQGQSTGQSSMGSSPGMMGMCQPKGPQMAHGSPMQKMGCCPMIGQGKMSEMGSGTEGGIFGSQVTPRFAKRILCAF